MSSFLNSIAKRKKTPSDLVTTAKSALLILVDPAASADSKSASEKTIEKRLLQIKVILYGDGDASKVSQANAAAPGSDVDDSKATELSRCLQQEHLIAMLIEHISIVPFESRKDTALVFNNLCRKDWHRFATVYLAENFHIVYKLIDGYAFSDSALSCGSMLREAIRYEHLHRLVLYSPAADPTPPSSSAAAAAIAEEPLVASSSLLWIFCDNYVHLPNFDIASDAFNTLRELLVSTKNKALASEFIELQYDGVFQRYESLLNSDNYVTRRRSLKMLGEILLDRSNFNVMIKYISAKNNLKTIMNLLRDKSPNIQFEAFHVFKIFVAYPRKPPEITSILFKNKSKLIAYLTAFHNDKDDPQFIDEKKLLIETLMGLEQPSSSAEGPSIS